jgi:hypothetical protein
MLSNNRQESGKRHSGNRPRDGGMWQSADFTRFAGPAG